MSYNLMLDDERSPSQITWIDLPLVNWVIVRNFDEFVKIINKQGLPLRVSFDNDLADEHYKAYFEESKYNSNYLETFKFKEKTGYEAAKWLVNYCMENNLDLPEYYIHTMNVIAKENIKSLFESYEKSRK